MASLTPYLTFGGTCRDALTFYQSCLGGELRLQAFADSPAAAHVPAEMQNQIVHGQLRTDAFTLMASDAGGMALTPGDTVVLCLHCGSDEEITRLFAQLGAGGTVQEPLADMFWGDKYGTLTDRFGTKWMFNFNRSAA